MVAEDKDVDQTAGRQTAGYRSIFKATSLFGGVQVYQILMDIIRSKFIAVLLGPAGVGIQGLYTSATQLIQHLTSFGLSSSAVRNVAEANASGDRTRMAKVVYALRRLVWMTGLLGMVAVIAFSPLLSRTSFGDSNHIIAFIIISVTLLLAQLSAGQKVILQGTRRLKWLAKSSAIGATLGVLIAVPLYYWLGIEGIVPNIVISAIATLILSWYFSKKVVVDKISVTSREVFTIGKSMMIMGIAMSISHLLSFASSYIMRACIRLWGDVDAVGLYTAGFLLMGQYTGLVFKAMGTDFYPRLSSVNHDNAKCREMMNQQGEIGMLILSPLLSLCVVFIPIVVMILYSEEFLAIDDYIVWCSLGMLFKMASWAISYLFVAKGESKLFIIIESVNAVYKLVLSLVGYKIAGLVGLGVAFSVSYFLYLIMVYCMARKRYDFDFGKSFVNIFLVELLLLIICVVSVVMLPTAWKYIIGSIIIVSTSLYSLKELNKRIDIKQFVYNKFSKKI